MEPQTNEAHRTQSTFVTVVAWLFIAGAGFATVVSVLQNIMISTMFRLDQFQSAAGSGANQIPPFAKFMMSHAQVPFLGFLALSVTTLVSAIALLYRKNWARIVFIVLFGLGIAWNIGALVLQYFMFSSMPEMMKDAPPGFDTGFRQMMVVMRAFSFVIAVAVSILFAWLIKRLASSAIRSEFT